MNLKYITFFLCAGVCTSTLLNDVIAMNGGQFPNINQMANGNGQSMYMPQQGDDMQQRIQQWNLNATNSNPIVHCSMQQNGITINFALPLDSFIYMMNQTFIGGQQQNQLNQADVQFLNMPQIGQQMNL